jgi:Uncharacterised protein family (UPF0164)
MMIMSRLMMKKILKQLLIPGILILGVCQAQAIDDAAGTSASAFMKIGIGSPRAQSLGRAYTALADAPDAMVWNPAGLGYVTKKGVSFSHLEWIQDYSGEYASYVHPLGKTVIGVNFAYMKIDGFPVYIDRNGNPVPQTNESVEAQNSFGGVSIGRAFLDGVLSLGATAKEVMENNDGVEYNNFAFDLGAQLHLGKIMRFGISAQNLGVDEAEVVRIIRYGASLHLSKYLTLVGEIEDPSDNRIKYGAGAEINLVEDLLQVARLSFRIGYQDIDDVGSNLDSDDFIDKIGIQDSSKITLGIGLYSGDFVGYEFGIDYALIPLGALGKAHQIAARFHF